MNGALLDELRMMDRHTVTLKVIRKIGMCQNNFGATDFNAAKAIMTLATIQ